MISVTFEQRLGDFGLRPSFEIPEKGVTALFGPSGCGKTTTLLTIAGLLRPRSGRISIGDHVLFDADLGLDLRPEDRAVGLVFQEARLFPHLSVRANLEYGARRRRARPPIAELGDTARQLGIAHLLDRRPNHLSGGEKQRVAIGRAILSAPRMLLLDEPLASLDEARKSDVLPFLEHLHEILPIPAIYVTHSLDEVARIADSVVLMDRGAAIGSGEVTHVMSRIDLPLLTNRSDVGAVLSGVVAENDDERGITKLLVGDAAMLVPLMSVSPGRRVRLRVLARDVAIATQPPQGLSMQNVLPCRIAELAPRGPTNQLARLDLGGSSLLSLLTSDSVRRLRLKQGLSVFALVKSVASGVYG
jgi:molybdate transport system ATP-binding protein